MDALVQLLVVAVVLLLYCIFRWRLSLDLEHVSGKLLDLHTEVRAGILDLNLNETIAVVEVDRLTYTGVYSKRFTRVPMHEFVVGSPMSVRLSNNRSSFWLKRPTGRDIAFRIETITGSGRSRIAA